MSKADFDYQLVSFDESLKRVADSFKIEDDNPTTPYFYAVRVVKCFGRIEKRLTFRYRSVFVYRVENAIFARIIKQYFIDI